MSYMAFYRKFRPKTFEDVIGQNHIVETLKNQIKADRIGHAYLFCGTRGTGKTSTAKIFARAVNCLNLQDGSPCNECELCQMALKNQGLNVVEIDAASNNSVDSIRDIREEVKYTPTKGRFKVYIIDEVHMLSTGAFNALLKTLEEPPEHIIFILATTEPHKILPTILSRCQRYDFKRISVEAITDCLIKYMESESIDIEEQAIKYIARIADGAMRDALSILDQCVSFYLGKKITLDNVLSVLGAVDEEVFFDMSKALYEQDITYVLKILDQVQMQGRDLSQFLISLINHHRNMLVVKSIDHAELILDLSEDNIKRLKAQADLISIDVMTKFITDLSQLENEIKYANQKKTLIEVGFIKLCQPEMDESFDGLLNRMSNLENKFEKGIKVIQSKGISSSDTSSTSNEKTRPKPQKKLAKAVPDDVKKLAEQWSGVRAQLGSKEEALKAILTNISAGYIEGDLLYLIAEKDIYKDILLSQDEKKLELIKKTIENVYNKSYNIKVVTQNEYDMKYQEVYGNGPVQQEGENPNDEFDRLARMVDFDYEIR